jgi:hypothetical protein
MSIARFLQRFLLIFTMISSILRIPSTGVLDPEPVGSGSNTPVEGIRNILLIIVKTSKKRSRNLNF